MYTAEQSDVNPQPKLYIRLRGWGFYAKPKQSFYVEPRSPPPRVLPSILAWPLGYDKEPPAEFYIATWQEFYVEPPPVHVAVNSV